MSRRPARARPRGRPQFHSAAVAFDGDYWLRDYEAWLQNYDDPTSGVSWRLKVVQGAIVAALDARQGPVRIISVCAGDGRDIIGVLAERGDRNRMSVTLLEVHTAVANRGPCPVGFQKSATGADLRL